jgi:tRNA pseudouridine38-40 synthase
VGTCKDSKVFPGETVSALCTGLGISLIHPGRSCDSRVYEYVLPSYCLLPPQAGDPLAKNLDDSSPGWKTGLGVSAEFADAGADLMSGGEDVESVEGEKKDGKEADDQMGEEKTDQVKREEREKLDKSSRGEYERRRGWRVDKDTLERFRALIKEFTGTQ